MRSTKTDAKSKTIVNTSLDTGLLEGVGILLGFRGEPESFIDIHIHVILSEQGLDPSACASIRCHDEMALN